MGDAAAPQQLSFFSEDADCLLGSPLKKAKLDQDSSTATPSPAQSNSDSSPSPSATLSAAQLATLRAEGLGVSSDGKLTCVICKMAGRGKKMRFCTPCARDVAAAKKMPKKMGGLTCTKSRPRLMTPSCS